MSGGGAGIGFFIYFRIQSLQIDLDLFVCQAGRQSRGGKEHSEEDKQ